MPKIKDLKDIKQKIQSIGNEPGILKEKDLPLNDTSLPGDSTGSQKDDLLTGNVIDEKPEDLLSEIREDFDHGFELKETDDIPDTGLEKENIIDDYSGNMSLPNIDDETGVSGEGLDDFLNDLSKDTKGGPSDAGGQDNIDDFLKDISDGQDAPDMSFEEEQSSDKTDESGSTDDMEALLSDLGGSDRGGDLKLDDEQSVAETEDLSGQSFDEQNEELSALMTGMDDTGGDKGDGGQNFDNLLKDLGVSKDEDGLKNEGIDELNELLGEGSALSEDNMMGKTEEEAPAEEPLFEVHDDLSDLAGNFGAEQPLVEEEGIMPDISEQNLMETDGSELPKTDEDILESIIDTSLDDIPPVNEDALSDIEKEQTGGLQEDDLFETDKSGEIPDGELPSDLSSLDELSGEGFDFKDDGSLPADKAGDASGFDIESLDSLNEFGMEEPQPSYQEEAKPEKQKVKSSLKDTSFGRMPEELSGSDIHANEDVEIKLTDDQRKQIVITLTELPKDAEIKIAKAISGGKYSNKQLKPLIEALIDAKSPVSIIRYYERITGDRSLSKVEAVKRFTGEKFEEFQKSFGYTLQKNILPLLARMFVFIFITALLAFFGFVFVGPKILAYNNYKTGLSKIDGKLYWDAEEYYNKGFNYSPSLKQTLKYAEKYAEHKRYKEAEKKYDFAVTYWYPPGNETVMKYAGFLTMTGKYDAAEKKYLELIKTSDKNIQARLGLAQNYFEWSDEIKSKLNDAEDAYKLVLDIDENNRDALFGNLRVYLKMKNQKKIMAQYSYINRRIKRGYDPETMAYLAEYLIDKNEIDTVKEVLDKAFKSVKKGHYVPELFYQQARYKRELKIFDEERKHLNAALKVFDIIKNSDRDKYQSKKYQNLLAKVYNALGENYDMSQKASVEAEKYFNKAIEADPDYGMPYYNLANFALNNKEGGYAEAKELYLRAESKGFANDRLNYNLGVIYYREGDFYSSYLRIINLMEKFEYNSNLKFMIGTLYYKMANYELSESMLLEAYIYFTDLLNRQINNDPEDKDYMQAVNMLKQISNNLGASYQKKFETTKNTKYLVRANKYYSDAIKFVDTLRGSSVKESPHQNLRMVLYPYSGVEDPFIYEDFPYNFMSTL